MDSIGQWITIFLTFSNHPRNIFPWVAIVLHGFDNFDNRIYILNIFLDVLGFYFIYVLFLLQFSYSFVLILFYLFILFPCYLSKLFLLFIYCFFIFQKILIHWFIEGFIVFDGIVLILDVFVWWKLEIFHLLRLLAHSLFALFRRLFEQISLVFRFKIIFQKL